MPSSMSYLLSYLRSLCLSYGYLSIRSQILVSRLDPLKEEPYRGTLVKYTPYDLEVAFEESFDVSEGVWR